MRNLTFSSLINEDYFQLKLLIHEISLKQTFKHVRLNEINNKNISNISNNYSGFRRSNVFAKQCWLELESLSQTDSLTICCLNMISTTNCINKGKLIKSSLAFSLLVCLYPQFKVINYPSHKNVISWVALFNSFWLFVKILSRSILPFIFSILINKSINLVLSWFLLSLCQSSLAVDWFADENYTKDPYTYGIIYHLHLYFTNKKAVD